MKIAIIGPTHSGKTTLMQAIKDMTGMADADLRNESDADEDIVILKGPQEIGNYANAHPDDAIKVIVVLPNGVDAVMEQQAMAAKFLSKQEILDEEALYNTVMDDIRDHTYGYYQNHVLSYKCQVNSYADNDWAKHFARLMGLYITTHRNMKQLIKIAIARKALPSDKPGYTKLYYSDHTETLSTDVMADKVTASDEGFVCTLQKLFETGDIFEKIAPDWFTAHIKDDEIAWMGWHTWGIAYNDGQDETSFTLEYDGTADTLYRLWTEFCKESGIDPKSISYIEEIKP